MVLERKVLYALPGMEDVHVENVTYQSVNGLDYTMNVYHPPNDGSKKKPAMVYVFGYPDGVEMIGGKMKDMNAYISWARLTAAAGFVSVQYETTEPLRDIRKALEYIKENAESLCIDQNKIGVWVCSGNTPTALTILMDVSLDYPQCAVIYYGLLMDWDDELGISDLSKQVEFAYPERVEPFINIRKDIPIFMVRAGLDDVPNCNKSQDGFIKKALEYNLPLTMINYRNGQHAFDLLDDNDETRQIIKQTLAFMKTHLAQ